MTKKGQNLSDDDHVMRYVPWARLRRDEDDNVIGFLGEAFTLRPDEEALSVNWLEFFGGDLHNRIQQSVIAFRANYNVTKKSAFGVGKVCKIKEISRANGPSVRIVFAPTTKHPSHTEIKNLPRDGMELFDALAADAFVDLVRNADVP